MYFQVFNNRKHKENSNENKWICGFVEHGRQLWAEIEGWRE